MIFKSVRRCSIAVLLAWALSGSGEVSAQAVIAPSSTAATTQQLQGCGSMGAPVGTLNSLSSVVSLNCPGAGTYDVRIVPNMSTPLVGTLTSNDAALPAAPSGRRLYKNGVGSLEVSSESLSGGTAPLTYRTNGGDNLTIGLSAYTSGSAQVYITASFSSSMVLINGPIDTREEAALRNGKAFTTFTGNLVVTATQYMSLVFTNPAGSGNRDIITYRGLQCDNPTSVLASKWWGLANPTTNLPTTAAYVSNRKTGGASATATVALTQSATTYPDTNPATALTSRPGGMIPTGGVAGGPLHRIRTIEPGQSTSIMLLAIAQPSGLGTANPTCSIEMDWYEEGTS